MAHDNSSAIDMHLWSREYDNLLSQLITIYNNNKHLTVHFATSSI